jgi:mono/diheme cytochrome c family protein
MRSLPFALLLVSTVAVAASTNAPVDDHVEEAGRTFQAQCLSCHTPPDLRLATDRAWLDQVKRTA